MKQVQGKRRLLRLKDKATAIEEGGAVERGGEAEGALEKDGRGEQRNAGKEEQREKALQRHDKRKYEAEEGGDVIEGETEGEGNRRVEEISEISGRAIQEAAVGKGREGEEDRSSH